MRAQDFVSYYHYFLRLGNLISIFHSDLESGGLEMSHKSNQVKIWGVPDSHKT